MKIVEILNGVVRPLVTIGFALTVQYGFLVGKVDKNEILGIAGMIFGFWFMQRTQTKGDSSNDKILSTSPTNGTPVSTVSSPK